MRYEVMDKYELIELIEARDNEISILLSCVNRLALENRDIKHELESKDYRIIFATADENGKVKVKDEW
jgi:hypothetical protein